MAKCDPFRFNGITADAYNRISKELADKGFALTGPQGVVNGPFGIVIEYDWNEQDQSLELKVVEKSFFVTCNQIREQITSAMSKFA